MRRIVKCIIVICATVLPNSSLAQPDFDTNQRALDMIRDFAEGLCDTVQTKGNSQYISLSGTAKTELRGVIKKVADLGIQGAAKYQSADYEGVLQADLAKLLSNQTTCKLEVWRDLKDKLIDTPSNNTPQKGGLAPLTPDQSMAGSIQFDAPIAYGTEPNSSIKLFSLKLVRLQRQPNDVLRADFLHTSIETDYVLGLYRPEISTYLVDNEGNEYRATSSEGITYPRDDRYVSSSGMKNYRRFPQEVGKKYSIFFPNIPQDTTLLHFQAEYWGMGRGCCFPYKVALRNIKIN